MFEKLLSFVSRGQIASDALQFLQVDPFDQTLQFSQGD